ncbi:hypothetical protein V8C86DRAFT_1510047 [Haematococcus lacustris]
MAIAAARVAGIDSNIPPRSMRVHCIPRAMWSIGLLAPLLLSMCSRCASTSAVTTQGFRAGGMVVLSQPPASVVLGTMSLGGADISTSAYIPAYLVETDATRIGQCFEVQGSDAMSMFHGFVQIVGKVPRPRLQSYHQTSGMFYVIMPNAAGSMEANADEVHHNMTPITYKQVSCQLQTGPAQAKAAPAIKPTAISMWHSLRSLLQNPDLFLQREGQPPGSFPGSSAPTQQSQSQGFGAQAASGTQSTGPTVVYSGGFQSGWVDSSYGGSSTSYANNAGGKSGGLALCKLIPNGGALSMYNGGSSSAFVGKQVLEYWAYLASNPLPPLLLTLVSNQQGDVCATQDISRVSQAENANGWVRFQVPLTSFQSRTGDSFQGCSNQGSPYNVVKIEFQNRSSRSAQICIDAVQLR